jgi:YD repeat-containing protein
MGRPHLLDLGNGAEREWSYASGPGEDQALLAITLRDSAGDLFRRQYDWDGAGNLRSWQESEVATAAGSLPHERFDCDDDGISSLLGCTLAGSLRESGFSYPYDLAGPASPTTVLRAAPGGGRMRA